MGGTNDTEFCILFGRNDSWVEGWSSSTRTRAHGLGLTGVFGMIEGLFPLSSFEKSCIWKTLLFSIMWPPQGPGSVII